MKYRLTLVVALLLATVNLHAQTVEQVLEKFIEHEMTDKDLPALSIALVNDRQVVWSKGFGFANTKTKVAATADTVYRVPESFAKFVPHTERPTGMATGYLWTLDGRTFEAPTPATGVYTTVGDLGRLLSKVAALGGGTVPGFATRVAALPHDKLGVVVITSKDQANGVTRHIADVALKAMLAERQHKPIPQPEIPSPVDPALARRIAGRYMRDHRGFDLIERGGKLSLLAVDGGLQNSLRSLGDVLVVDDALSYGKKIVVRGDEILLGGKTFKRVATAKPAAPPARWTGLIGEYGEDTDILYILEKDQKLWALVHWFEFDPVDKRFAFTRDTTGHATSVAVSNVVFQRRKVGPEEGANQLRITPLRPMADLLREALAAEPPKETGDFRTPGLVELTALDPSIKLEVRYATTNNFLGTVFYSQARAFMQRPAAEALVRAHHNLRKMGYGLLIHDAYRPWYVTRMFWDATPDDKKMFVADPSQGSRHNRGCAVDLTLYDLNSGKPVQMVSTYDETTDRAYADYPGGTSLQRWQRQVLREAMEAEKFTVFPFEWWHFDYQDWRSYPIMNVRFENIGRQQ